MNLAYFLLAAIERQGEAALRQLCWQHLRSLDPREANQVSTQTKPSTLASSHGNRRSKGIKNCKGGKSGSANG